MCFRLLYHIRNLSNCDVGVKTIYLTFDDGPHETHTEHLLDLLKIHEVKATFFVTGNSLSKNKHIGKRIVEEGHVLGNHTYSHKLLPYLSKNEMSEEILSCQNLIEEYQDNSIRLFRPPCGLAGIRELMFLKQNTFKYCLWTIDSNDSFHLGTDVIIKHLKSKIGTGSVILFHDDSVICIHVLQQLLPCLISNGYIFKLISET